MRYKISNALNSPTPRNMLKTPPKDAEIDIEYKLYYSKIITTLLRLYM